MKSSRFGTVASLSLICLLDSQANIIKVPDNNISAMKPVKTKNIFLTERNNLKKQVAALQNVFMQSTSTIQLYGAASVERELNLDLVTNRVLREIITPSSKISHSKTRVKRKLLPIHIIINDKLEAFDINSLGGHLEMSAEMELDSQNRGRRIYRLNGDITDVEALSNKAEEQKSILDIKNAYLTAKSDANLRELARFFKSKKNRKRVLTAAKEHRSSVVVDVSVQELLSLLTKASTLISAIDLADVMEYSSTAIQRQGINNLNGYLTGTSVAQIHGPWKSSFPNADGRGVGVYISDAQCPNDLNLFGHQDVFNYSTVSYTDLEQRDPRFGDRPGFEHTRTIIGILGSVAPKVSIICDRGSLGTTADTYYDKLLPSQETIEQYNINIESYSINYPAEYPNADIYNGADLDLDNHTYKYRTIPVLVSAGNFPNTKVRSPGKAFNVITVGGYSRGGVGRQIMEKNSSYLDPVVSNGKNKIAKPEVVAPAAGFYYNETKLDSGTSYATPFAAGLMANMMSHGWGTKGVQYAWWKNSAAMNKAIMIAGATDKVSGTYDQHGEGGVDLFTMTWRLTYAGYGYTAIGNTKRAERYPQKCFSNWKTTFYDNHDQRVVISWLNKIDNMATMTQIPNKYRLELLNASGSVVARANKDNQGYQVINTSQPAGQYTLRICAERTDNYHFDLGFAVSQRPKNASWWHQ